MRTIDAADSDSRISAPNTAEQKCNRKISAPMFGQIGRFHALHYLATAAVLLLFISIVACGGSNGGGTNPRPSQPQLSSIYPTSITAGEQAFTLTVNGSNFINGSVVQWNGSARPTTFVNSGRLTAAIAASDIASPSTIQITVSTVDAFSTAVTFTISVQPNPQPTISSISPTSATAGDLGLNLTVDGTGFINGSTIQWNGANRTTTFVSSTRLTSEIPASDLVSVGTVNVTVVNPTPGGGTSIAATFTINAVQDFLLSVTPAQLLVAAGSSSNPISIAIAGQNGFDGVATILLSGLPDGFSSQPASPFTIAAGHNQLVTISAPANAPLTGFALLIAAVGSSISHNAQVAVSLTETRTFDDGAGMLYLETKTLNDTTRVGLRKSWGGSIVEVSLNGTDYVNNDDPGRQIQVSLWDGNANYSSSWGYNPIEAGDHSFQGSPLLAYDLQPESLYTKTQPIQWAPENFGGGYGAPVLGDAYIEKWISVVPGYSRVFKIHYKITHFGSDWHADAPQELPVVYVNPNVSKFFYYSGDAPWTNGVLSQFTMPGGCCPNLYTPEKWGAYVDDTNAGLALYTPMQFPNSKGFNAGSTLQFTPLCPTSWDPGAVLEFDTFVLVGPLDESRIAIYALHDQQSGPSPLPPFGYLDFPAPGSALTGAAIVQGWAWALAGLTSVDILIDGVKVGSATIHLPRDISSVYPGTPSDVGYEYALDTTKFSNGNHTVLVRATDANGHVATFRAAQVNITN